MSDNVENQNLSRIPPPPDEYSVRTMQSDIASLASSGGAGPQFVPMGTITPSADVKKSDTLVTVLIFIAAIVVAGLAAYYFFFMR